MIIVQSYHYDLGKSVKHRAGRAVTGVIQTHSCLHNVVVLCNNIIMLIALCFRGRVNATTA